MVAAINSNCQATLILGVPNQEGLLIVSDKLGHNTVTGYSDDIDKVVQLTTNAAFAISGTAIYAWEKYSGTNVLYKDRLSSWDLAKNYFVTNPVEKFNVEYFAECMSEQLSNYFAYTKLNPMASEAPGCQFIVFRTNPSKKCETFIALLLFKQSSSGIRISTSHQEAVQTSSDPALTLSFGSAELPLELWRGHDPRFDDVRNIPIISKFLPAPPPIKKVTLSEAQVFARTLMAEASSKTQLINPDSKIGTNLDETILRF